MPRRANDPNLLRAQASGGREGANAYDRAAQETQAQRRQAVQTAMQEAAMRGVPAGALAQIRADVANPYNQSIRQLTSESASYQAAMQARNQRLGAYDTAIQSARTLIPSQVAMAVAPIRAQNQFMLQQQQMEGEQRLDEIEANTRLQLAQIRAQQLAQRIEARRQAATDAANRPTLTEGELQAALENSALGQVDVAGQRIGSAVEQGGQRALAQSVQDIIAGAIKGAPSAAAASQAQAMQMALGLGSMAVGQQIGQQMAGDGGGGPDQASLSDIERYHQTYQRAFQEDVPGAPNPFEPSSGSQFGQAIAAQQGDQTQTPGGMFASWNPNLTRAASMPVTEEAAPEEPEVDQTALDQLSAANQASGIYGARAGAATRQANQIYAQSPTEVEPLSQYGMLSEQQVAGLNPYAEQLVRKAPEPFMDVGSVRRLLFGEPTVSYDPLTDTASADVSPYAADVKEQAMVLAAQQLGNRYKITGPEVQNAIAGTPESLFDLMQARAGQPTTADRVTQAELDARRDLASKEAEDTTNRANIERAFVEQYKVPVPTGVGDIEDIGQVAFSPQFFAAWNALQAILNEAGFDMDYDQAITEALSQAGVEPDMYTRQLLKAMVS